MTSILPRWTVLLIGVVLGFSIARGETGAQPANDGLPVITKLLVIEPSLRSIRSPLFVDPIEHAIATGTFQPPAPGVVVPAPTATSADVGGTGEPKPAEARTWRWLEAKKEAAPAPATPTDPTDPGTRPIDSTGSVRFEDGALSGGYAFATVTSAVRRVVMLDAAGHRHVYVSSHGEDGKGPLTWSPRVGDVYENGLVRVPIVLEAGETHLLFRAGRGGLTIGFSAPAKAVFIEERNATFPTVLRDDPGTTGGYQGAIVVVNADERWSRGLRLSAGEPGPKAVEGARDEELSLPPLSVTKVPLIFWVDKQDPRLTPEAERYPLRVVLGRDGLVADERSFALDLRSRHEKHTRTFRSETDGSIQYFAVVPPSAQPKADEKLALILSLHGASVEATNQAGAYSPKDWAWIVCPTNRRPFGFDWEDWGRLDAMEVLAEARRLFNPDPRRLYLTGHSMGGHGTWHLGVTYPGLFAAIAPSAGWPDFWTYTGAGEWAGDDAVRVALRRAAAPSRTLEITDRLKDTPIYILHGDKDDNVPVSMARTMVGKLANHEDLAYHEQPGASHWWGNECVDWPALMAFLKARTLKEPLTEIPDVPISAGGFKDAFRYGSVLVYGTHGSPEENAWALAKTRFDSETFLYRGNASLRVMSDEEFVAAPGRAELGAVFYGNERSNSAWAKLADTSHPEIKGGSGLGVLAIVARRDGTRRVGLVGGSDLAGMRLTTQMPYFVSGVAYPEWFVVGSDALMSGIRGVRGAGWFSDKP